MAEKKTTVRQHIRTVVSRNKSIGSTPAKGGTSEPFSKPNPRPTGVTIVGGGTNKEFDKPTEGVDVLRRS